jgi:cyclohexa-1,5-dienecarbonyl-CoA hydratase
MTLFRTISAELSEENAVLRVCLRQPPGNVLTIEMMRELGAALAEHGRMPELKLVAIRGAAGEFSFGASIHEHRPSDVRTLLETFHSTLRQIAAYPVPVAAVVEGRCLGGGFELVLCCHLVLATGRATFGCPEIKLGVFPPVLAAIGGERLPGALAERLLLTGEVLSTAELARVGFVADVLDERDPEGAFLDWYRSHLQPLSAFALRQATAAIRRQSAIRRGLEERLPTIERQYLREVVPSHDGTEGIAAFLEHRRPAWKNR